MVEACNSVGCVNSSESKGMTNQDSKLKNIESIVTLSQFIIILFGSQGSVTNTCSVLKNKYF